MAADKYLKIDLTNGRVTQQQAVDAGGSGNAGKIVALNSSGYIDATMYGAGTAGTAIEVIAAVNLAAGDFVNVYYSGSQKLARKATATDTTAPAHGFVIDPITATSSGTMYLDSVNSTIPRGVFTTADIGKRVFLSTTAGGITLTPPSTTGNLIQVLGVIIDVNTTTNLMQVDVEITDGIVV